MKRRNSWQPSARALAELKPLTAAGSLSSPHRLLAATLEDAAGLGPLPTAKERVHWGPLLPHSREDQSWELMETRSEPSSEDASVVSDLETVELIIKYLTLSIPVKRIKSCWPDRRGLSPPCSKLFPGGGLVTSSAYWVHVPLDPAISLLGIYPTHVPAHVFKSG